MFVRFHFRRPPGQRFVCALSAHFNLLDFSNNDSSLSRSIHLCRALACHRLGQEELEAGCPRDTSALFGHGVQSATPDTETVHIPTRTRQRAMDWSLALLSQGIESEIRHEPELGWELLVPAAESERARATIEQFRRENLRWPWRREVWQGRALFDWSALVWVLTTAFFFAGGDGLRAAGLLDATKVAGGEWFRLFTAEVLHADLMHFATNAVFGLLLLGLALGRFGSGVGLLAAFLSGTAGNLLSLLFHERTLRSLGASGVVMGALGLLAAQSWPQLKHHPRATRLAVAGVAGGVMLFLVLGTNPGSDVAAHLGGFLAGIIFGSALSFVPRLPERSGLNLIAIFLFLALLLAPWWLALRLAR